MDLGLLSKNVVVTGGSRGIGRAIALAFADEGANVAICARGEDALAKVAGELRQTNVTVFAKATDIAYPAALDAFLEEARNALGGVHVLVKNAATWSHTDTEAAWETILNLDVMAAVRAVWKVVPWMKDAGGGAIVHISSIAGLEGGWPPSYAAAKAALISHSKSMAIELASAKIRINTVTPGCIEFPGGSWEKVKLTDHVAYGAYLNTIPWGRMGTAEEVADAVVFFASDRASWITGACLTMDGGQHRGNL